MSPAEVRAPWVCRSPSNVRPASGRPRCSPTSPQGPGRLIAHPGASGPQINSESTGNISPGSTRGGSASAAPDRNRERAETARVAESLRLVHPAARLQRSEVTDRGPIMPQRTPLGDEILDAE